MHARLLVRSALSLTFLSPGEGHRENERVAIFVEVLTCIKVSNGKESQISNYICIFKLHIFTRIERVMRSSRSYCLSWRGWKWPASRRPISLLRTTDGPALLLLTCFLRFVTAPKDASLAPRRRLPYGRKREESNSVPQSTTNLPFKLLK